MADLPIINNLKEKLIPGRNHNDDDGDFGVNDSTDSPENDVLEQYRIALNTELRDDIITPSKLDKVRFGVTQPKGFSFKQVEAFHTEVTKSIQWYIATLEKRDRDVHKLATEIDKYKTDVQNTRFQLEVLQGVGGQAMVDGSGNYITESQLSDDQLKTIELENRLRELESDLLYERKINKDLQNKLDNAPAAVPAPVALPPVAAPSLAGVPTSAELAELNDLRERQIELDEWEEAVKVEYNRVETELEETKALLESKTAELEETKALLAVKTAELLKSQQELSGKAGEFSGLAEQVAAYEASLAEHQEQVATLTAQLNEADVEFGKVSDERDAALTELEELRNSEPETVQDESVVAELAQAQERVAALDAEVAGLNTKIDELNEYIDVVEAEYAEAQKAAPQTASTSQVPGYRLPNGVTPEDLGL